VAPGEHTLRLKIDWMGSDEVRFHLAAGQTAVFVCGPNGSATTAPAHLLKRTRPWIALAKA
jgi:hypothetical protein